MRVTVVLELALIRAYHSPYGPPYGEWAQYRFEMTSPDVKRPRARRATVLAIGQ